MRLRHFVQLAGLIALFAGSDSVMDWGWYNLGYQARFTPIAVGK